MGGGSYGFIDLNYDYLSHIPIIIILNPIL